MPARAFAAPWRDRQGHVSTTKVSALAVVSLPAALIAYWAGSGALGALPLEPLIYHSGSYACWLLLLALAVTPARRMFGWSRLIMARRILGVAAFAYAAGHLAAYIALRGGDPARIGSEIATRVTIVVAITSLLGLAVLAATSSDAAIRRLGGRWGRLHRIVHAAAGLAILHYVLSPGSAGGEPFLMVGIFSWLVGWRLLDRRGLSARIPALMALGVGTALLTAVFEAVALDVLQGFDPWQTLAFNLSLDLGLAPAWKVLGGGLSAAAAVFYRNPAALDRPRPKAPH
ncbi:protein-methionine-sulfoxide reductase heme-binding subunit MsrQ [Arenibaculum pallidiluteum]|uniref:sulfite oxidase heme-binding subunit YedZ n=1 Tax=Arenibaculum pallidiluteum TaxID=2812559 RepID=UPI001A974E74|nr:ferric reductase-like transmembrane domain-containing protein [Arenibaculum pallidiluteum]